MSQLLSAGHVVRMRPSGLPCVVQQLLGGGGQGEVYRASLAGNAVALKWYHPARATVQQRATIETLIRMGPPTERFLALSRFR